MGNRTVQSGNQFEKYCLSFSVVTSPPPGYERSAFKMTRGKGLSLLKQSAAGSSLQLVLTQLKQSALGGLGLGLGL